ncbi:MAG TPA: lipopolysaccharide biosynthesis protein [Candidatus Angelobacter sp.]|nr:lipopolysaccharide biosynthesis protein [Candidatus Angelobacter sp.]
MPLSSTNKLIEKPPEPAVRNSQWYEWLDAIDYLWSRRLRIALWAIAGLVFSLLLASRICKYPAMVQLMPPDTSSSGGAMGLALPSILKSPGLAGLAGMAGDLLGAKSTGALFIKVLQSRTVEDDLVNRFDLRTRYHTKYWEDARNRLQSRTTIAEDKKSGVIMITVRDRDPQFAAALAGGYVDALDHVMSQASTSAARRERIFIEQRLADEKKALEDAEEKFSRFSSSNMAPNIPEQTRVMVESAARLQGELIAARSEMEGLRQVYTPENTRVKTIQARISELERELARINTGQQTGGDGSLNPYPSIKNLPLVGVTWTDLYRNTKIHETVYELLTQQYEVARIQEARELPTVKVLDKPAVPEERHPSIPSVTLIGTLISIVLACFGLLLQRWWASWDADDPRRLLLARISHRNRSD